MSVKIKGYRFQCESPIFVYFRKHYCPCCGERLLRQKVSRIVHSDSPEAKDYDFEIADITVKGNVKFTHIAFHCPICRKNYSVRELKEGENNGF